ncbi:MAG: hypothetical protein ACKO1F_03720 [Flammeovirgaceae bacterium]
MKAFSFIIILIVLITCSPSTKDRIDKILISDKFTIKAHTQGCFGDSEMTFRVFRKMDTVRFEYPISVGAPTKYHTKNLNENEIEVLREFLNQGLMESKNGNFCTNTTVYRIENYFRLASFEVRHCELYKYLEKLMQ